MLLSHSGLVLLLVGSAMSSSIVFQRRHRQHDNEAVTHTQELSRTKRQSDGGSILNDIFQIPIQTLSAVGQLFVSVRNQRDKRRNPNNSNNANNYNNGQNSYNNGQTAYNNGHNSYNDAQTSYNNGYNAYNSGQTAYNNGNSVYNSRPLINAYASSNSRPLIYPYSTVNKPANPYNTNSRPLLSPSNNIGANAFDSNTSGGSNANAGYYNRPYHYLSQLMAGINRISRTNGAKVAQLSVASDGSSFKI